MKRTHIILLLTLAILSVLSFNNATESINVVGSTSIQPVLEKLADEYKKTNPNIDINVQGGGSGLGIKCANNSLANIGMSSKEIENNTGLKTYELGRESIIIVVNQNNPLNDLSKKQLRQIFSGEISNWNEITNKTGKINVIVREAGSGTLDAFKSTIMNSTPIKKDAVVQNSAGSVKNSIVNDENAIGFVSLAHIDKTLKNISIDGISPLAETIKNNEYSIQRPFLLITNSTPNKETQDFINWATSNQTVTLLEEEKIIKVD